MTTLRVWLARLLMIVRRRQLDAGMAEEISAHLDQLEDDHRARGLSAQAARDAARRDFGGVESMKQTYRELSTFAIVELIAKDVRFAARTLRKNSAFTLTAAATLALAIGANTAMFSVVDAVLLRPLPYRSPGQLAMLWIGTPGQGSQDRAAFATAEEWRRQSRTFADMALFDPVSVTLTNENGSERVSVARISPNFFPMLGVQPALGRTFSLRESEQRQRLAVISYRFWQSRLGGSSAAIGASIVLDGVPSEIIGVLPASAELPGLSADVWEPHTLFSDWETRRAARGVGSWFVLGRLQPDVTIDQAQEEMAAIARAVDVELPAADRNRSITVIPLSHYVVGPTSRLALWMLAGAVFCVLIIAAANVVSLSLARAVGRFREFALRASLGATPARIVRQLLTESTMLAVLSGVLGTVLALAAIRLIRVLGPRDLARLNEVSLDPRVVGWTLILSLEFLWESVRRS